MKSNELELISKIVRSDFFSDVPEYQEQLTVGVELLPKVLLQMGVVDEESVTFKDVSYFLRSHDYLNAGLEKMERRAMRALINEFDMRLNGGAKLENIAKNAGIL